MKIEFNVSVTHPLPIRHFYFASLVGRKRLINRTMASHYFSPEALDFLLFQVHDVLGLTHYPRYEDYDEASIRILLQSVKDYADQECFPFYKVMDEEPVRYSDGRIVVHEQLEHILRRGAELGILGSWFDYDEGGMQLPQLVHYALVHILDAANNNVSGYFGLTSGAADLIRSFGSEYLKETYIPRMLTGEWMGTMALTEPQAGSFLADIRTSATPLEDGTYHIEGHKIFISGGDHQFAENFVHLVLARIKGAPLDTRGISLFVVPKNRATDGGELVYNNVQTIADFDKMGQRGYATTHLAFGESGTCHGWLVGEANQGLRCMFKMMNEARISVGVSGASMATAAFHASKEYADQRRQGRQYQSNGRKDYSEEAVPISRHPDVQRMLQLQHAITMGSVSLVLECARLLDVIHVGTEEEATQAQNLLDILTPVVKAYPTEAGIVSVSNGLQVLGGYGFMNDFPLQQYYRDIRITSIYEGTTGIQAIDLLGRKVMIKEGALVKELMAALQETISEASEFMDLKSYADRLATKMQGVGAVLKHMGARGKANGFDHYIADATIFLEYLSLLVIGWQWLKMATKAHHAKNSVGSNIDKDLCIRMEQSMQFFFKYELSKMSGLEEVLLNDDMVTVKQTETVEIPE